MNPREQCDALRVLAGLDFSALEEENKRDYEQRTEANREAKMQSSAAKLISVPDSTPNEPVSIAGIMTELRTAEQHNRNVEACKSEREKKVTERESILAGAHEEEVEARKHA